MSTPRMPVVSPRAVRVMAFPESLGASDKWGDSERWTATAVIQAHLLAPRDELRRRQDQLILLAAEIDEFEPLDDIQAAEKLKAPDLRTRLSVELPLLAKRSADTLERALVFDANKPTRGRKSKAKNAKGKRYGRAIRDVLTVGLIVMIMYRRVATGAEGYSPAAVMKLIHDEGKTNAMFVRSDKEMKAAWWRLRYSPRVGQVWR
jgi:hypothetical protein